MSDAGCVAPCAGRLRGPGRRGRTHGTCARGARGARARVGARGARAPVWDACTPRVSCPARSRVPVLGTSPSIPGPRGVPSVHATVLCLWPHTPTSATGPGLYAPDTSYC
eukprot:5641134-Pleurochrysis_carterae.AAC.1